MQKTPRKLIAALLATLLLMTVIVPTMSSAADQTVEISKESSRLATTVNAFARNPYTKTGQWLWANDAKFMAKQYAVNETKGYLSTGTTASQFIESQAKSRKIDFTIGAAGMFYGITAKVSYNLNYKHSTTTETNTYNNEFYYDYQYRKSLSNLQLIGYTPSNVGSLWEKVRTDVQTDLLSMDPATFFETYGTHLVLGYDKGAQLDIGARASTNRSDLKLTETEDIKHTIPISVGAIGGIVDISATVMINDIQQISKQWKEESVTVKTSTGTTGGPDFVSAAPFQDDPASVEAKIKEWAGKVDDSNAGIVANDNLLLAPVWDLLPAGNTERKAKLMRTYYAKAAEITDGFFAQEVYYVANGVPTKQGTEIKTKADLDKLRSSNNQSIYYLGNDIDLGGAGFTPIPSFKGTFDGVGYEIKGLNVNTSGNAGLFGTVDGGTIKNLRVSGTVKGSDKAGGIAARLVGGKIYNVTSSVNVSSNGDTTRPRFGGIVGEMSNGAKVFNSINHGSVSATHKLPKTDSLTVTDENVLLSSTPAAIVVAGGIAGASNGGQITSCANYGSVKATGTGWKYNVSSADPSHYYKQTDAAVAGGIVGLVSGVTDTNDNLNAGNVESTIATGGIVGEVLGTSVGNRLLELINNLNIGSLVQKGVDALCAKILDGSGVSVGTGGIKYSGNLFQNGTVSSPIGIGLDAESTRKTESYSHFDKYTGWVIDSGKVPYPQKKVAGITIDNSSVKTYTEYGSVKFGDIKVTERYSDGTTKSGIQTGFKTIYNFDPGDPNNNIKNKIIVVKDDCFDVLSITVNPIIITKLEKLEVNPDIGQNGTLNPNDVLLRATLSNGEVIIPNANAVTFTGFDPTKGGNQNVTAIVTYGGAQESVSFSLVYTPSTGTGETGTGGGNSNGGNGENGGNGNNGGNNGGSGNNSGSGNTDTKNYIPGTKYEANFGNWLLYIFFFGFIWMKSK